MINKIKKKIGEMFGKKEAAITKKEEVIKEVKVVSKEEVKKETAVRENKKREENTKKPEGKRRDGEGQKGSGRDKNVRVRQDHNHRRNERGENGRRHSDSSSRGRSNNRRDSGGKKNYSERKSNENFNKRVPKEEKLSNWIEEGIRSIVEGSVLQYDNHSITVSKKNTLGIEVKIDNTKECKITFDEMITAFKGLNGIHEIKGELLSGECDKNMVIRGVFQKN